jgi:WD40 repeat protein
VVFSKDSKSVVSVGFDRHVRVWSAADGKETAKLGPTSDDLYCVARSPDGKHYATAGYSGVITVWDLAAGKAVMTRKIPSPCYCVMFTPDGQSVISGHDNYNGYVTKVEPGKKP